jgi:hypothetical protein
MTATPKRPISSPRAHPLAEIFPTPRSAAADLAIAGLAFGCGANR